LVFERIEVEQKSSPEFASYGFCFGFSICIPDNHYRYFKFGKIEKVYMQFSVMQGQLIKTRPTIARLRHLKFFFRLYFDLSI